MKKTLIALAALAATGAFAQSSVVLDGYFDRGFTVTNSNNNSKDFKGVASSAGTTTFGIKVREDLGGGLSIGGSVNTDWAELGGATQANGTGTAQTGGFANSQSFVDVTGSFGVIRLGTPNNFTLTNATAVAAPAFSTAIGSSYSSQFSIANGLGTGVTGYGGTVRETTNAATGNAGARAIRISNTIQYSSPVFSGFSGHLGYTPKNNNYASTYPTTGVSGNTVGVTEAALRYTAGPIDAMLSSIKYSVGSNGTTQYYFDGTAASAVTGATPATVGGSVTSVGVGSKSLAGSLTSTQNLLGVTYAVLPTLKLHGGYGMFSSSNDAYKGKSVQLGATYTMGAWDLMGQYVKVNDQSTTDADRKMIGLGANYNLSKTARVYFRYDSINWASNQAEVSTGSTATKQTRYALGVSKSF